MKKNKVEKSMLLQQLEFKMKQDEKRYRTIRELKISTALLLALVSFVLNIIIILKIAK